MANWWDSSASIAEPLHEAEEDQAVTIRNVVWYRKLGSGALALLSVPLMIEFEHVCSLSCSEIFVLKMSCRARDEMNR